MKVLRRHAQDNSKYIVHGQIWVVKRSRRMMFIIVFLSELLSAAPTPLLKIILLYDEFSNTAIIEQSISEIFLNDPTCYIMTIQDFEILLYTYKHNYPQFKNVLNSMSYPKGEKRERKCATVILEEHSLRDNLHFNGDRDYFKKLLKYFGTQLKN